MRRLTFPLPLPNDPNTHARHHTCVASQPAAAPAAAMVEAAPDATDACECTEPRVLVRPVRRIVGGETMNWSTRAAPQRIIAKQGLRGLLARAKASMRYNKSHTH